MIVSSCLSCSDFAAINTSMQNASTFFFPLPKGDVTSLLKGWDPQDLEKKKKKKKHLVARSSLDTDHLHLHDYDDGPDVSDSWEKKMLLLPLEMPL